MSRGRFSLEDQRAEPRPASMKVHIWSGQWRRWWRPEGHGYTAELDEAGVYGLGDAWARTGHCGAEKRIFFVPVGDRSERLEVRNPVLALEGVQGLRDLSPATRAALGLLLKSISVDAAARAQASWTRNKGPMAAYWKAVSVYAKHIRRAVAR